MIEIVLKNHYLYISSASVIVPSDTTPNAVFLDFLLKCSRIKVQQCDGSDGSGGSAPFVTGGLEPQDGSGPIMSPKVQKLNCIIGIKGHLHLSKTYLIEVGASGCKTSHTSQPSNKNTGLDESKQKSKMRL